MEKEEAPSSETVPLPRWVWTHKRVTETLVVNLFYSKERVQLRTFHYGTSKKQTRRNKGDSSHHKHIGTEHAQCFSGTLFDL
ncbi:hypothetical protein SKAU_G00289690 [Synaphobranchus kaupii]|uniref:Uncharacterized protein n=1 Tax=Synaphobranchus kaupii TaxID=118154 RepID=A0A9Q1ETG2_SYNKA|nr:hypothetical protein SKAU_G00289690 [Synaphobranchus kaupii]